MTYSDCWISTVDDEAFQATIRHQKKLGTKHGDRLDLLPSPPGSSHYWLPIVKDWALAREIPVQYVDNSWIRIPVSRVQLIEFLEETFGPRPEPTASRLQAYVRNHFRADKTYIIEAEEF